MASHVLTVPVAALEVIADWSVVNNSQQNASRPDDEEGANVITSWGDGGDVTGKSGTGAGPSATGQGQFGLVGFKSTDADGEAAVAALLADTKAARDYIS